MRLATITTVAALLSVAAFLVAAPLAGAATNVHTASLSGSATFSAVKGKAKYGIDNGIRRLEAEVDNAKRLAGIRLNVRVNGMLVGSMNVNSLGTGLLRVSGAVVPFVGTGSKIVVRRASNGVLVASGTFA